MKFSYFSKAVGVTFDDRQETIASLAGNARLKLRREPDNPYDANAIAIDALVGKGWKPVGYIAKDKNEHLAKEMDNGTKCGVELTEVTGGGDKNYGLNIAVSYEPAGELNLVRLVPDIGTGYVMFDEDNHRYFDEDGNQMISGSVFESNHKPEVNFSYAAKAMAKNTGAKADDILELWGENRDLSAAYGTAVHKGLEVYFKNHELMKQLDSSKERPHTAVTYMPREIGNIVDKYLADKPSDFADRSSAEVFVRHGNRCGFIDLLEEGTDGLVMHDYKFIKQLKNIKYTTYGTHPAYSLQQNFYREVLEANGHKVKAMLLDTYVDGEWQTVEVKRIKLED